MEFLKVVGDRRSVRWFRPWEPVDPASVQRILETARWCGCPGNLQPWRAVVVVQRIWTPPTASVCSTRPPAAPARAGAGLDLLVRRRHRRGSRRLLPPDRAGVEGRGAGGVRRLERRRRPERDRGRRAGAVGHAAAAPDGARLAAGVRGGARDAGDERGHHPRDPRRGQRGPRHLPADRIGPLGGPDALRGARAA